MATAAQKITSIAQLLKVTAGAELRDSIGDPDYPDAWLKKREVKALKIAMGVTAFRVWARDIVDERKTQGDANFTTSRAKL